MLRRCVVFLAMVSVFAGVELIKADTLEVGSTYPYLTIQSAVDDACDGDVLLVYDGTYTEDLLVDVDIQLRSANGADVTTIELVDANGIWFDPQVNGFTLGDLTHDYGFTIVANAATTNVVYLNGARNVRLGHNSIDCLSGGDVVVDVSGSGSTLLTVAYNRISVGSDATVFGVSGTISNMNFTGNTFNLGSGATVLGITGTLSDLIFMNNICQGASAAGSKALAVAASAACSDLTFSENTFIEATLNVELGDADFTGLTVANNIFQDCAGAMVFYCIPVVVEEMEEGVDGELRSISITGNSFENLNAVDAVVLVLDESLAARNIDFTTFDFSRNDILVGAGLSGAAVDNQIGSTLLKAELNYWGQEDGPSGGGIGSGAEISAGVDYSPWRGYDQETVPQCYYTNDQIGPACAGAADGDNVVIYDGVYRGEGNRDILIQNKTLHIRSMGGSSECVMDLDAMLGDAHYAFRFEGSDSTVRGLTITNGYMDQGGALYLTNGRTYFEDCVFVKNSALERGGVMRLLGAAMPIFKECIFTCNGKPWDGGVAYCSNNCELTLINCEVSGNQANYKGGAFVCSYNDTLKLINCAVVGNKTSHTSTTEQYGGAIYCQDNSDVSIVNTLMVGNETRDRGGAMYFYGNGSNPGRVSIINSTLCGNTSLGSYGGGLFFSQLSVSSQILNSILADNNAPSVLSGNELALSNCSNDIMSIAYSNVLDGASMIYDPGSGDSYVWDNSLSADPCFAKREWAEGQWTQGGQYDPCTLTVLLTDYYANYPDGWEPHSLAGYFINPDLTQNLAYVIVDNTSTTVTIQADYGMLIAGGSGVGTRDAYRICNYHLGDDSPCIDSGSTVQLPTDVYDMDNDGDTAEALSVDYDYYMRVVDSPEHPDTGEGLGDIVDMGVFEYGSYYAHYLQWDMIGDPQHENVPFEATVTAYNVGGDVADWFGAEVPLSGKGRIVTEDANMPIGTDTLSWDSPLTTGWHSARTQVIYGADEITMEGSIRGLSIYVETVHPYDELREVPNWTIRLRHCEADSYGVYDPCHPLDPCWVDDSKWTTVFRDDVMLAAGQWNEFVFDEPYAYNGVDNLMVDFSLHNTGNIFWNDVLCYSSEDDPCVMRSGYNYAFIEEGYGDPRYWSDTELAPELDAKRPNVVFRMYQTQLMDLDLEPETLVGFTDGVWTGPIMVKQPAACAILTVGMTQATMADSNDFEVKSHWCGDADVDEVVNLSDFAALVSQWQQVECELGNYYCDLADMNQDGVVDMIDMAVLSQQWLMMEEDAQE